MNLEGERMQLLNSAAIKLGDMSRLVFLYNQRSGLLNIKLGDMNRLVFHL